MALTYVDMEKTSKRSKYNAVATEYNGVWYPSKKEAAYARELDLLTRAANPSERVTKIERQVPYHIDINGKRCFTYLLDFRIEYADGSVKHVDVKGYTKGPAYSMFRLKKKCVEAMHGIDIIEK